MKFLLDESADARLAPFLRFAGHDVSAIAVDHPASLADREVLTIAHREQRILITDDRDFGGLVFVEKQAHAGVIYLRIGHRSELTTKIDRLNEVLTRFADDLDQFLVVTKDRVRVRRS